MMKPRLYILVMPMNDKTREIPGKNTVGKLRMRSSAQWILHGCKVTIIHCDGGLEISDDIQ